MTKNTFWEIEVVEETLLDRPRRYSDGVIDYSISTSLKLKEHDSLLEDSEAETLAPSSACSAVHESCASSVSDLESRWSDVEVEEPPPVGPPGFWCPVAAQLHSARWSDEELEEPIPAGPPGAWCPVAAQLDSAQRCSAQSMRLPVAFTVLNPQSPALVGLPAALEARKAELAGVVSDLAAASMRALKKAETAERRSTRKITRKQASVA